MSKPGYLLDTNICIYLINHRPASVRERLSSLKTDDVAISSVTGAELMFGVIKSGSQRNRDALEKFLAAIKVIAFDASAMRSYGLLRSHLEKVGTPIGAMDMLIAAQALALDSCLVTNDLREFQRVPGLRLENWVS